MTKYVPSYNMCCFSKMLCFRIIINLASFVNHFPHKLIKCYHDISAAFIRHKIWYFNFELLSKTGGMDPRFLIQTQIL